MKTTSIYQKLHDADCDEGFEPSIEQFDLVAQLVTGYFGENYCEKLIDTADSSINVDKVALYLSMIGWESEAASKLTSESVDKWLQSKDLTRLRVALSQEIEWLPFKEHNEMVTVLNQVKGNFPEFSKRCEQLIKVSGKTRNV